ncbi:MAG: hypothetical protein GY834_11755 [Bacteroidetes bacterium]|nr:hypothetical protein [Bacteroidota bacterium]
MSKKFKGYEFSHAEQIFTMPKIGLLHRNGKELYRDQRTYDWWTQSSGAEISKNENFLIVRIWDADCIDLYRAKIFIISNRGQLLLVQDEWVANWNNGFFYEKNTLSYWSEWYCHLKNREEGKPFLYKLNDSYTKFTKQSVSNELYCSDDFKKSFEKKS